MSGIEIRRAIELIWRVGLGRSRIHGDQEREQAYNFGLVGTISSSREFRSR